MFRKELDGSMKRTSLTLAVLSLLLVGASQAKATVYEFSFSYSGANVGGGSVSGSGFLFGTDLGGGEFSLTSGFGSSTEAGSLTLEPAGTYINTLTPSVDLISDNLLSPSSNPALTGDGIVFLGSALPSTSDFFNIWGNGPNNYTYFNNYPGPFPAVNGILDSFTVTNLGVVPLPATWTMLLAGFIGLGFFAYGGAKKRAAEIVAS
jgi:hypothetical protein